MTDIRQDQTAPPQPKAPRFVKLKIALGMLPEPSGRPPYIWVERWNAFIVAALIAIGVPLLGFSGFPDYAKMWILVVWLALWVLFFVYFEGRELIGQMQGRGSIRSEQLTEQQKTAQDPFYGTIAAFVIWLVALVIHAALNMPPAPQSSTLSIVFVEIPRQLYRSYFATPIYFGAVEWFILVHAWIVTSYVNHIMYNIGNVFSKAAPMGERVERREH